jgi:hypothetical protein
MRISHRVVLCKIKSETKRDGRFLLFGNFGECRNEGIIGIQVVVQIRTCEDVETLKQAPEIRKGLHF